MRILQRAGASRLYLTGKCREFHQSNHSPRFDRRLTVPRDFTHLDDQGIVSPPNAYEAIHVICRPSSVVSSSSLFHGGSWHFCSSAQGNPEQGSLSLGGYYSHVG